MSTPLTPEDEAKRDAIIEKMLEGSVPRAVARLYVNSLYQQAYDEKVPYLLTLRWIGNKAEYAWGQFSSREQAIQVGEDAMGTKINTRRVVGYRVTDKRSEKTVTRKGGI